MEGLDYSQLQSCFRDEIKKYIEMRVKNGYKEFSFSYELRCFDRFCASRNVETIEKLSETDIKIFINRRGNIAPSTFNARLAKVKGFLDYLSGSGYKVPSFHLKQAKVDMYEPHIYTEAEVERYFTILDTYKYDLKINRILLPFLFRILYCCGTRITETLYIRKNDIDLDNHVIRLTKTKTGAERFVVMPESLNNVAKQFFYITSYLYDSETDYIFCNRGRQPITKGTARKYHSAIIEAANISCVDREGIPRLHDFRHTFAVRSFKNMIDKGMDMYTALPILSTYMGHSDIYSTEKYIRLTMEIYPSIGEACEEAYNKVFEGMLTCIE